MTAAPKMNRSFLPAMLALFIAGSVFGQHPWQKPLDRDSADIERIIGPVVETVLFS